MLNSGQSDGIWTFDELCTFVEKLGFVRKGGHVSHRVFVKDGIVEILDLQGDSGKAKRYQVKQIREIVARYDLKV